MSESVKLWELNTLQEVPYTLEEKLNRGHSGIFSTVQAQGNRLSEDKIKLKILSKKQFENKVKY